MIEISGAEAATIITGFLSLVGAVWVAWIKKKPDKSTKVDEYGFFYDQYQILYEGVLKENEVLKSESEELKEEINLLNNKITKLKQEIDNFKKKMREKNVELDYWTEEARTAFELLDLEINNKTKEED